MTNQMEQEAFNDGYECGRLEKHSARRWAAYEHLRAWMEGYKAGDYDRKQQPTVEVDETNDREGNSDVLTATAGAY